MGRRRTNLQGPRTEAAAGLDTGAPELRFTRHHTLADRVSDHLAVEAELEWLS